MSRFPTDGVSGARSPASWRPLSLTVLALALYGMGVLELRTSEAGRSTEQKQMLYNSSKNT